MLIFGKQAVKEALEGGKVERVMIADGLNDKTTRDLERLAKKKNVMFDIVPRIHLDRALKTTKHQGIAAELPTLGYSEIDAAYELAKSRGEDPFFILLDQLTDPHNYGAIIRSAEALGAHAVITEERRTASLSPIVVKSSAGAVNYLPLIQVKNLPRFIDDIKAQQFWVYGSSDKATHSPLDFDYSGSIALVIGSEGDGMRRLVEQKCDEVVKIDLSGNVNSLNASVAAGILINDMMRKRTQAKAKK